MAGLGRVIVGYRRRDPRRFELDKGPHPTRLVARCISCGTDTWFVRSGQDAYKQRDPEVICTFCYERHKDQVQAEL